MHHKILKKMKNSSAFNDKGIVIKNSHEFDIVITVCVDVCVTIIIHVKVRK